MKRIQDEILEQITLLKKRVIELDELDSILQRVPADVWFSIFKNLDDSTKVSVFSVCKVWNKVATDREHLLLKESEDFKLMRLKYSDIQTAHRRFRCVISRTGMPGMLLKYAKSERNAFMSRIFFGHIKNTSFGLNKVHFSRAHDTYLSIAFELIIELNIDFNVFKRVEFESLEGFLKYAKVFTVQLSDGKKINLLHG